MVAAEGAGIAEDIIAGRVIYVRPALDVIAGKAVGGRLASWDDAAPSVSLVCSLLQGAPVGGAVVGVPGHTNRLTLSAELIGLLAWEGLGGARVEQINLLVRDGLIENEMKALAVEFRK